MQTVKKYRDEDLIIMLKERKLTALSVLYDKYASALYGQVIKEVNDIQIAEHILEESFIQIWNNRLADIRDKNHLLLWMLNVAKQVTVKTVANINSNEAS